VKRRRFIATATASVAGSTPGRDAACVGFVTTEPAFRDTFVDALRRLAYQNGRNIIIDWRPNPHAGPRDVEDLVNLKPGCPSIGASSQSRAEAPNQDKLDGNFS
jgi:hypothetical protein